MIIMSANEAEKTTKNSSPSTDETQCSLCCDRTHSVSQFPTCLHSFCQLCLEQLCQSPLHSSCPKCQSNVQLSKIGLSSDVSAAKEPVPMGSLDLLCAQCKTGNVVTNCVQCIQLLCKNCSASHDSNHVVVKLDAIGSGVVAQKNDEADKLYVDKKALCTLGSSVPRKPFRLLDCSLSLRDIFQNKNGNSQDLCQEHGSEVARYYCQNCKKPMCGLCSTQGSCLGHEYVMLNDVLKEQNSSMGFAIEQSKAKMNDLLSSVSHLDLLSCQLKDQFEDSLSNIKKTFCFFSRVLLEHKEEMLLELKNVHTSKLNFLNSTRTEEVALKWPGDGERMGRMSLVEEHPETRINMAHLSIVGTHSTNGVAAIHSEILRRETFRDFYELWPQRFNNKTNGMTPRRWIVLCNPNLADAIGTLNGALTIGTLDGSNAEMREEMGAANFFLFGMDVHQVEDLAVKGYNPHEYYEKNSDLCQSIDMIAGGYFSPEDTNLFRDVIGSLMYHDKYMLFADYESYTDVQDKVGETYQGINVKREKFPPPFESLKKETETIEAGPFYKSDRRTTVCFEATAD